MARCPNGAICIENASLIFIIIISFFMFYCFSNYNKENNTNSISVIEIPYNNINYSNIYKPPTRSYNTPNYTQVGILTKNTNNGNIILPLIGKPLYIGRDKWKFYTLSNDNPMIKLPITFKNKSCLNQYGCDNLYNGDQVYVQGYNDLFSVTMYDTSLQYNDIF